MAMPRHRFDPDTASNAQRQAINAAIDAAQKATHAEAVLWASVEVARDLDVPLNYLADAIGRGRATVYRHIQPRDRGDD